MARTRMELGSEEALTDFKSYQLRRYLDYAESEGGVRAASHRGRPGTVCRLDGAKISRVNAARTAAFMEAVAGVHHERQGTVVHRRHARARGQKRRCSRSWTPMPPSRRCGS